MTGMFGGMATVDDLGATPTGVARRFRPVSLMIRLLSVVAVVAFSAFVGGFLVFADQVTNSRPPARPQADGIVALTGGAQRIEGAVDLLGRGSANRLLISGVYERTSPDALADRTPKLAALLDCCVDIGYAAHDTKGNARETREWARVNGYDSLIVVTSAYHMPRSLAEMARELPNVRLVPFPIHTEKLSGWYSNRQTLRLLLVEYTKYIVARLG
ncbi:YdcF family protein [Faunimonas sp. B44]|uniref:YdcF family protein n=1 Tax=Faunimonas sp. B44 TaxID=3461493 RepID=UPI004044B33D